MANWKPFWLAEKMLSCSEAENSLEGWRCAADRAEQWSRLSTAGCSGLGNLSQVGSQAWAEAGAQCLTHRACEDWYLLGHSHRRLQHIWGSEGHSLTSTSRQCHHCDRPQTDGRAQGSASSRGSGRFGSQCSLPGCCNHPATWNCCVKSLHVSCLYTCPSTSCIR